MASSSIPAWEGECPADDEAATKFYLERIVPQLEEYDPSKPIPPCGEQDPVTGVAANRVRRQVGCLRVETPRRQKYGKLSDVGRCSGTHLVC